MKLHSISRNREFGNNGGEEIRVHCSRNGGEVEAVVLKPEEIQKRLAMALTNTMFQAGLSSEDLGEILGVSGPTISAWREGKRTLPAWVIKAILKLTKNLSVISALVVDEDMTRASDGDLTKIFIKASKYVELYMKSVQKDSEGGERITGKELREIEHCCFEVIGACEEVYFRARQEYLTTNKHE